MPDPLVIAIFLTVVALAAAVGFTDFGPAVALDAWGASFWSLLRFTAQMILILVLGHVLANTRPVQRVLLGVAGQVRSARAAYIGLTLFSGLISLISWGLGLVLPAILSRLISDSCRRRGIKVHFPLLVAGGYCGAIVSMQGLSGSIPLVLNTPDHFLQDRIGLIGLDQTIFSAWSMSIVLAILIALPIVMSRLAPPDDETIEFEEPAPVVPPPVTLGPELRTPPAATLDNSRWVTLLLAGIGGAYVLRHFLSGGPLHLDSLNMIFVVLGLAFADSPRHYLALLGNAARISAPFLIQYPLYAGLMGLMAQSGLAAMVVRGFVSVADAGSLPIWTFFSAAVLNIFIPSAGGQWAVQGPIVVDAALQLGADVPRVAMAVTIGEVWTNAVQPLYVVPVLAIAGLHIRDIMGYLVISLLTLGPIYLAALMFF